MEEPPSDVTTTGGADASASAGAEPRLLNADQPFDVYRVYSDLVQRSDPSMPPWIAAISALKSALPLHRITTVTEAVSLLSSLSQTLKSRLANPIAASAGTDIFLHTLVTTVVKGGSDPSDIAKEIEMVSRVAQGYIDRGTRARLATRKYGKRIISNGTTVIVPFVDELVVGLLHDASEACIDFRVLFVCGSGRGTADGHHRRQEALVRQTVEQMDAQQVECATVAPEALAHTMASIRAGREYRNMIMIAGVSTILATGAVLSPLGTLQAALVAKAYNMHLFFVSELQKSVRWVPLRGSEETYCRPVQWGSTKTDAESGGDESNEVSMDITPPDLIEFFITERGLQTTHTVAEASVRKWY